MCDAKENREKMSARTPGGEELLPRTPHTQLGRISSVHFSSRSFLSHHARRTKRKGTTRTLYWVLDTGFINQVYKYKHRKLPSLSIDINCYDLFQVLFYGWSSARLGPTEGLNRKRLWVFGCCRTRNRYVFSTLFQHICIDSSVCSLPRVQDKALLID